MNKETRELIASLYAGRISKSDFFQMFFNAQQPNEDLISELLNNGIQNKDEDNIEEAIVLFHIKAYPSSPFVSELCHLLQMPWHTRHEDIALLLKEIADPSTVECLHKVAELQFQYLDYDEDYQLGRKCIKALSAIGDENAITKLKSLSKSKIPAIARYAEKELLHK